MKPSPAIARIAAAAALVLSLAGCDRTPVGTDADLLPGTWMSDSQLQSYSTPSGERMMQRTELWVFYPPGRYDRRATLYDEAAGKVYFDYLEYGSYAVPRDGELELKPEQAFYRAPNQFESQPVLQPAPDITLPFRFSVRGGDLTTISGCPAGFDCIESQTLVLHRANGLD